MLLSQQDPGGVGAALENEASRKASLTTTKTGETALKKPPSSPWVIKRESAEMKKQESRFKWNIATMQVAEDIIEEKFAAASAAEGGDEEEQKKAAKAMHEQKLEQLIGAGGRNVHGLKEHLLLRALTKRPEARSDDDLDMLQKATSDVKFFGRLEKSQHRELCRVMRYELVPKETVLFSQGDEGTTFYIVFRGAVDINGKVRSTLGNCVGMLEDGDSFGELALLGNGIRNASVVTCVATRLLKVEKTAYETSLMKVSVVTAADAAACGGRPCGGDRVLAIVDW